MDEFLGKVIVVGVTYFASDGKPKGSDIGHGTIVRMNEKEGIVIRVEPKKHEFKIPPDTTAVQRAPRGQYKESTTGMTVENPDLIAFWEVHDIPPEKGGGTSWKPRRDFELPYDGL